MVVNQELSKLGIHHKGVSLGQVEITTPTTDHQHEKLKTGLFEYGLELIDDKKKVVVEKIKNVVIEMVHYSDELPQIKFSRYLSQKLNYDYTYLSNLFSQSVGTTIEKFVLLHKVEKVKELIVYDELNITEIAWKLHYSSVAHLSYQFKKITGLTPSDFKSLKNKNRNVLENV
jgi:AraC-like DNA-binding protein